MDFNKIAEKRVGNACCIVRSHIWSLHNFQCVHISEFKSHPSGAWHLGNDSVIAFGTQSHAALELCPSTLSFITNYNQNSHKNNYNSLAKMCAWLCESLTSVAFFFSRSFYFCVKRHSQRCRCYSYHFVMRHIQNYSKTLQIRHGVQWAFGTHSLPLSSALVSVRLVFLYRWKKENTEKHYHLDSSENCMEFHFWFNKRAMAT